MAHPPILFPSSAAANRLIAGVPAAVRAVRYLKEATGAQSLEFMVAMPEEDGLSKRTLREIERLIPATPVQAVSILSLPIDSLAIDGLSLLKDGQPPQPRSIRQIPLLDPAGVRLLFKATERQAIARTGKPTDGLVSRTLNRPVSQFISARLLRLSWARPIHATIACSLIGVVMALCLFMGGELGLIAGAVLFQLASIIDGVDGEMARATWRSSKLGATLDTAGDAATNFAFIGGVCFNLRSAGDALTGQLGLAALAMLAVGLALLGIKSVRSDGVLSFDALKHDPRTRASPMMRRLAQIASRDVYALGFALMILAGLAREAVIVFGLVVAVWLMVVLVQLVRSPTKSGD